MPRALSVYNTTSRAQQGANYLPGRPLLPKSRRESMKQLTNFISVKCQKTTVDSAVTRPEINSFKPAKQEAEIPSCSDHVRSDGGSPSLIA